MAKVYLHSRKHPTGGSWKRRHPRAEVPPQSGGGSPWRSTGSTGPQRLWRTAIRLANPNLNFIWDEDYFLEVATHHQITILESFIWFLKVLWWWIIPASIMSGLGNMIESVLRVKRPRIPKSAILAIIVREIIFFFTWVASALPSIVVLTISSDVQHPVHSGPTAHHLVNEEPSSSSSSPTMIRLFVIRKSNFILCQRAIGIDRFSSLDRLCCQAQLGIAW